MIAKGLRFIVVYTILIVSLFVFMQVNTVLAQGGHDCTLRLNMKSYGNHDENSYSTLLGTVPYDTRLLYVKPEYLIDNPPHGLYGEMDHQLYGYAYDELDYLLQNVVGMQTEGIKVIGYITGGYEGAGGDDGYPAYWYSQVLNELLITNMADIDGVDGVFIDECTDFPNVAQKAYLVALTTLAHNKGLITWGNTGVDIFDPWFFTTGGFDFMQSSEAWIGQPLSVVQQNYGDQISVTRFKSSYTAQNAYDLTVDAWQKGLAYCYVNTTEYTSIAPWFEEYTDMLRQRVEGDANLNEHVTITDAMLIAQYVVGLRTLSETQLNCCDTNDDGKVSVVDAMHIAQWVVDPTGVAGVLHKPLWESPVDNAMIVPRS